MRKTLVRRRLVDPILELLRQGITPEKIALSLALGITLGVTPVLGSTTALCALAAVWFRLNLAAIQLVNYVVYPLQILLLIPFMRMGAWMVGAESMEISVNQILSMIRTDPGGAVGVLWISTLHALLAWLLLGLIASAALYFGLTAVFRHWRRGTLHPQAS